eukprot:7966728-Pyramimonas_sp.AAC.1
MSVRSCRFTPATHPISWRPMRLAWLAQSMATNVDEQAVSMAKQGPRRPRAWEMRPDRPLIPAPML